VPAGPDHRRGPCRGRVRARARLVKRANGCRSGLSRTTIAHSGASGSRRLRPRIDDDLVNEQVEQLPAPLQALALPRILKAGGEGYTRKRGISRRTLYRPC
jgi:hypothetical protein